MRKFTAFLILAVATTLGGPVSAADTVVSSPPPEEQPTRELYVPFDALNVILESGPRRVMLSRSEYDDLRRRAHKTAKEKAPRDALLSAANYVATLADERATLSGRLSLQVLADGLHAVPLDLGNVGLVRAVLDGKGAAIGRADDGRLVLFVEGKGRHTLELEMVAPLETTAARQILRARLPVPPAATMRLEVPGDVELKSGAAVVSRQFDEAAARTRIDLLPPRGPMALVMTLNSRLKRQERLVVARSVVVDEVTRAYERLHTTFSMDVLHSAVTGFRFAVPDGFDITDVSSPYLSRWAISGEAAGRRVLEVFLSEETTETVVLKIIGIRTSPTLDAWRFPTIEPLETVSHMSVVGLVVEDRLKAEGIAAKNLIPIDVAVLTPALPATATGAAGDAVLTRPVVAYYAPHAGFDLAARFVKPPAEVSVTTNVLLMLMDRGHEVRAAFAVLPQEEKLFALDILVPRTWQVSELLGDGEKALPYERYDRGDGGSRIHVRFPRGVAIGTVAKVVLSARSVPANWLGDWTSTQVTFPDFAVAGATRDVGAIAVQARDDMTARPERVENLTRLTSNEMAAYGLEGVPANLAYRYESRPYAATIAVRRQEPRMTARTFNFFRVERDTLVVRYELEYDVSGARTRQLVLELPKGTPETLSITGLGEAKVKEFNPESVGELRRWTAHLTERLRGTVRLAVEFKQKLGGVEHRGLELPIVRAAGVDYQSGLISVEGDAELDIQANAGSLRKVDVGELVDAAHQPGRRLLGVWSFVGDKAPVSLDIAKRDPYALPTAIVQHVELRTVLGSDGLSLNDARFGLRTKAQFLKIDLPEGSELWSATLDGKPTKPQREGDSLLVSLGTAASGDATARALHVVYRTPVGALAMWTRPQLAAPRLSVHAGAGRPGVRVPVADLTWQLHLPRGYRVIRSHGSVVTDEVAAPTLALAALPGRILAFGGGAGLDHGLLGQLVLPTLSREYEAADGAADLFADEDFDASKKEVSRFTKSYGMAPRETEAAATDEPMPDATKSRTDLQAGSRLTAAGEDGGPGGPAAAPTPSKPAGKRPARRDRLGKRSLVMAIDAAGEHTAAITFRNLGEDPVLDIVAIDTRRVGSLTWALAGAVILMGLALTRSTVRRKTAYVVAVAFLATAAPIVSGRMELALVTNAAVDAACLLVVWYVVAALGRRLIGVCRRWHGRNEWVRVATVVAIASGVLVFVAAPAAMAAKPDTAPYVIQVIKPGPPVAVPDDAIIVPYDPAKGGPEKADRLLIDYDRFVKLWNEAHPDKQIEAVKPQMPYALAGAAFTGTLSGDEFLLLEGYVDVQVFVDGFVEVPLSLAGGVLASAELDGRPARLGVAEITRKPPPPARNKQRRQQQVKVPNAGRLRESAVVVAYIKGKGRHRLSLAVRLRLERRGGWRQASGRLPAAPATSLALRVPDAGTEIRLGGVQDRRIYETAKPGREIITALDPGARLSVQWRPKVAEGEVDRGLTAESSAVVDIREDRLAVAWRLALSFRGGQREFFSVTVPAGYIVEKVEGTNVRGWQNRDSAAGQTLEVSLLKEASDNERFTVHMWRPERFDGAAAKRLAVPVVDVAGAIRHSGTVSVRRSPLLEVRLLSSEGAARTDLPAAESRQALAADNPLGLRSWQAYRFASTPVAIVLEAQPLERWAEATVQSVLKIAERERMLESKVIVHVRKQPLYRVTLHVPSELKIEAVLAPGEFEWAVREVPVAEGAWDHKELTIYLARGHTGNVPVVVRGKLGGVGAVRTVPVPRLDVVAVRRQTGQIVVQVDPAFDVRLAGGSRNLEPVPLARTWRWVARGQRSLARLALGYKRPDVAGQLVLSRRTPTVSGYTVTNVRVTDRSLQETILLGLTVERAGIGEVVFRLPERMADARISVPGLRLKTVEPAVDGRVTVRLELEDEMLGELRVLIEDDRLLTGDVHAVPIPELLTGTTDARYLALESAGRDEVAVASAEGVDPLGRQMREYQRVAGLLGGGTTQAYLVSPGAVAPRLAFRTRQRALVKTAGARIGLARTTLIVDAGGAYRGQVVYDVGNRTEQYLEIELPEGAELWTAQVEGEPVKPVAPPSGSPAGRLLVPIVKTDVGDLDYRVVLKYAGKMTEPGGLARRAFPLVRTVNIAVELSQVELMLPEDLVWLDFGGTMTRVDQAGDIEAGIVDYMNRQQWRLLQAVSSENVFQKVRARSNLKKLGKSFGRYAQEIGEDTALSDNPTLFKNLKANEDLQRETARQEAAVDDAEKRVILDDNSLSIRRHFSRQYNKRATNIVNDAGNNWAGDKLTVAPQGAVGGRFNDQWLKMNKLQPSSGPSDSVRQPQGGKAVDESWQRRQQQRQSYAGRKPEAAGIGKYVKGKKSEQGGLSSELELKDLRRLGDAEGNDIAGQAFRYKQHLERQAGGQGEMGVPAPRSRATRSEWLSEDRGRMDSVTPVDASITTTVGYFGVASQGKASLMDVALPRPEKGYRTYRFTTPQGDVAITARAVSNEAVDSLTRIVLVVVAAALACWMTRLVRRRTHGGMAPRVASTVLVVLGTVALVFGLVPLYGLAALAAGVVWKVSLKMQQGRPSAA
jgi:hypothetical protein